MDYFLNLNPIIQTLYATIFTFLVTALGASLVFFFKKVNKNILDAMLGISAGVMIAASFFSLLNPAVSMSENLNMNVWLVLFIGFTLGGILLYVTGIIFDRLLIKNKQSTSLKRSIMLVLSITIHNIPEGMAVGVAFASTMYNIEGATTYAAIMLALGIGIQNFPEGSAISLPLRREGTSRFKSFFYGSLSGIVEIISGIIGALLVLKIRILLPYLLSFAAGAMIYVVIEELIPESQSNEKKDLMALFTLIGFSIMMILDVALS
ncbi:MAG: ZIP family metal transporter [Bacilli bacterium]|nr:ZIP family metal transporter [Bacilli bacterium]